MSGPARGPAEGVDGHSTKAADTPMHESCEACHSPGRTTPRGERRAPSWLTSAATEHGRGSQAPSATPSTASRSCERQSRKALEPGLVGGPTGRWRAARPPLQVGSDLGHDLLGAANRRRPAAFAAGTALAAPGWGRGPHGDLVPGDLLVDGDGHGYLGSVGDGRTYPPRAVVAKSPIRDPGIWPVAVALVTPRRVHVPIATLP